MGLLAEAKASATGVDIRKLFVPIHVMVMGMIAEAKASATVV
ncbi:hypothetical protein [Syntrophomonas zehnderi]|nr:hypothetical protein [Syntrophomonas zehnderi]